jgi:hypothetical protein
MGRGHSAPQRGASIESLCNHSAMGGLKRIAPIFAVRDLDVAMAHYERLGFATRAYHGGGYGFATRDGVEIHLGVVPMQDQQSNSAYLFVDDADVLAEEWRSAGVEVHLECPRFGGH